MKGQIQNRILAFFLAMVMLCTSAPFPAISVEPEEPVQNVEQEGTATSVYSKYVGSLAEISFDFYSYLVISDDPSIAVQDGQELVATDMTDPLVLEIVDYYWDEESCALWYKVKAAPGCTLPEKLQQYPWAFQNYTDVYEEEDWESYSPDSLIIHENMEIPTLSSDTGVTVSAFNLPEGATLAVKIPEVDGKPLPGVYDIKIYLADGVTEWQPIDEGKTVTISIPVEGVADGEYVEVLHIIDYSNDIDGDEDILSTLGMDESALALLQPALDAYGNDTNVAVEVMDSVTIFDGVASVETDSFSVYYYNLEQKYYTTGDADKGTNPANLTNIGNDDDKYYFASRGDYVYFYGTGVLWGEQWTLSHPEAFGNVEKTDYKAGALDAYTVYRVQILDTAVFYDQGYTIKCNGSRASINIVVMPTVTINFETHLTNGDQIFDLPAPIPNTALGEPNIFLGNYEEAITAAMTQDQLNNLFANGDYPALEKNIPLATPKPGVTGYKCVGWYLKHEPTIEFRAEGNAAEIPILLSDDKLQVKLEDNVDHYEITLVAIVEVEDHIITYKDGETSHSVPYIFEEEITIEKPSKAGYVFTGWKILDENLDLIQNWTEKFEAANRIVPGGTALINMYGDVTLEAQWEEAGDTQYKVYHYYQNTAGDGYDVSPVVDTLYGTTNDNTRAELAQRVLLGFEVESVEEKQIAADGSTEVIIRYIRKTVTVTFDSLGGSTVNPVTGLYDAPFTAPTAPEREHYVFLGWYTADDPDNLYTFSTIPATDLTLYAKWNIKKATITFIDPLNNSVLDVINEDAGMTVNAPAPKKDGYNFGGWYTDTTYATKFEFPYTLNGDDNITLYAKWEANKYTVTFKDYNGEVIETQTVEYGKSATAPAAPDHEGYTFTGWDVAFDNVTSDLTVTAQYEINQYTVKFVDWDGTELKTETVSHGGSATAPADPTREGYTFTGWDVAFDNVTSNLTVTAQYEIKTYTVTFVDWDGTELKTETVNHGSSATAPADPTREGYTFAGWDKGYSNVTSNLTVTAQYAVNTYTITWIVDGNETTETYEYGAAITPPADPEKEGHTFAGWSPAVPATMPAEDLELVAQWTVKQYQVVISCDKPGAVVVSGAGTYAYGTSAPICIKPVDGYRIKSITRNGVVWGTANQDGTPNNESVKENLTIVITVEAILYTITYDLDGGTVAGSNPEGYTVESGEITLINPTRTGYTFAGWTGTGLDDATMEVTIPAGSIGNRAYTATWKINTYTVTWIVNGNKTTETYEYGATPTFKGSTDKAADAQYTYTFAGWTPAIDTVTGEATYTATYTQTKRAYTVTYERGFGLGSTTQEYLWGTTVTIDVVDPAYTGFAFLGWQCDIAGCACAEGVYHQFGYAFTMPAADVVLTAKWDPKPYTLTYNGEGVMQTQEFYAAGKTVVVAAAPIRDGYKFTGWKDEVTGTVYQPGDEFTMPEENVTLTAQWTVKTYTITFVDWNGNVLQTAQVQYGIMPAAPANPSRPWTMDYSYEFTGWSPAVVNVTGDQTYTATYKARQHYVYIGINYSYHMSTYQYTYPSDGHSKQNAYHQFPNEPRELWMEAMRAAYQPDGSWSLYPADNSGQLTGLPSDFINETLLKQHAVTTNSAYGVFDSTGDLVKACFQFSADDATNTQMYEALIKAWLKQGILGGTDIYWDKVPPENCKVIPYVVKQQGSGNWYVDMVIVVDETSLTIEAPKVEGSDGQIFLFEITATDHPGFGFVVAVSEGKSVVINGLFPGKEYIVKELTGWSWRSTKTPTWAYTTDENPNYSGILPNLDTSGEGDTATFTLGTTSNKLVVSNTWADTDWLGDEAYLDNKFPPYVEITP